jgi:ribonuclease HI
MPKDIQKGAAPYQIDYVLMSQRWASGVSNCKVSWGHTPWRWAKEKYDHGMIEFKWRCRFKTPKPSSASKVDWTKLKDPKTRTAFDACLSQLVHKQRAPPPKTTGKMTAYTDGGERKNKAGWGAVILNEKSDVEAELWGPVLTDPHDPLYLHATALTNNTGELTAIAEALIYILYIDKSNRAVEIIYDSTLAGNIANGHFAPGCNIALAHLTRRLYRRVEAMRGPITTTHVYSHTDESLVPGDKKYVPWYRPWTENGTGSWTTSPHAAS